MSNPSSWTEQRSHSFGRYPHVSCLVTAFVLREAVGAQSTDWHVARALSAQGRPNHTADVALQKYSNTSHFRLKVSFASETEKKEQFYASSITSALYGGEGMALQKYKTLCDDRVGQSEYYGFEPPEELEFVRDTLGKSIDEMHQVGLPPYCLHTGLAYLPNHITPGQKNFLRDSHQYLFAFQKNEDIFEAMWKHYGLDGDLYQQTLSTCETSLGFAAERVVPRADDGSNPRYSIAAIGADFKTEILQVTTVDGVVEMLGLLDDAFIRPIHEADPDMAIAQRGMQMHYRKWQPQKLKA